ncbi:hypothetical protein RvY_02159 [Ramazzottius varieornatus]|uniref:Uncharacterized protein n=1 Tax=Ramazzottius varieornatus TaxID=947166 RepID=A0A1D1UIT2_RAMVA|nr:hypothetical protein RvY_02159 [Ramazzottius varieornatus]
MTPLPASSYSAIMILAQVIAESTRGRHDYDFSDGARLAGHFHNRTFVSTGSRSVPINVKKLTNFTRGFHLANRMADSWSAVCGAGNTICTKTGIYRPHHTIMAYPLYIKSFVFTAKTRDTLLGAMLASVLVLAFLAALIRLR